MVIRTHNCAPTLSFYAITLDPPADFKWNSEVRAMGSDKAAGSSSSSAGNNDGGRKKKRSLGWIEWGRGWCKVTEEFLFQRIKARHLENPLTLPPLDGVTFIVTGTTSGIGLEIARQLAQAGAHVVMAVRRPKFAQELIQKWQDEQAGIEMPFNAEVMELDLLSLDSVVRFAEAWNARLAPLHALINNAGIFSMGERQRFSKDGYDDHMQVNHLAPALLSMLLLPSLLRGSPSRIVNVNSIMHVIGFVDTNDMNVTSGERLYTSLMGYAGSKLSQARELPKILLSIYKLVPYFIFNPIEGSRSALFAAADPQVSDYCALLKADKWPVCPYISSDCRPMNASEEARNLETSQEVWEKTLDMIGLSPDSLEKLIEGEQVQCRYGSVTQ